VPSKSKSLDSADAVKETKSCDIEGPHMGADAQLNRPSRGGRAGVDFVDIVFFLGPLQRREKKPPSFWGPLHSPSVAMGPRAYAFFPRGKSRSASGRREKRFDRQHRKRAADVARMIGGDR